jgi:hypothetical protein
MTMADAETYLAARHGYDRAAARDLLRKIRDGRAGWWDEPTFSIDYSTAGGRWGKGRFQFLEDAPEREEPAAPAKRALAGLQGAAGAQVNLCAGSGEAWAGDALPACPVCRQGYAELRVRMPVRFHGQWADSIPAHSAR